jgi:hypothetical protein
LEAVANFLKTRAQRPPGQNERSTSKALFAALDEASKNKYLTLAKEERETWELKMEERKRTETAAIQG